MPPDISTSNITHILPKSRPTLSVHRSPSTTSSSSNSASSSSSSLSTLGIETSDDRHPNPESSSQPDLANAVNTSSSSSTGFSSHGRPSPTSQKFKKMMEIQSPVAAPVGIPIKASTHVTLPPSLLEFGKRRSGNRGGARKQSKENTAPSVAALKILAATAIPARPSPPKTSLITRGGARPKPRISRKEGSDLSPTSLESPSSLLEFALNEALDEKSPPLTRSNSQTFLTVLLSPPDLVDEFSLGASPPRSSFSVRSLSSDSIPSLANDDEGTFSWGAPVTPSPLRRSSKLNKTFSPPEECVLDHPLLTPEGQEPELSSSDDDVDPATVYTEQARKLSAFSKLSFKSNLTASLRVLRSAARTFTSLSTPLTQPDDFLTRSILSISPQYNTDEKRPDYRDIPTPALRRYLNPSPKTFSRELGQFNDRNESISASIQLQTYKETIITPPPEVPITRNREVRENSDFLRVIVLEMNMRRQGKLSDTSQGKARFVLPPRQTTKMRPLGDREHWKPIVYE
ncbi:hypothetical protein ABW19_dt0201142 [Dactylella cylindrospora]|nr:hypothetical protein ABW19_dt0201142 [Dactylella cylindrospora]